MSELIVVSVARLEGDCATAQIWQVPEDTALAVQELMRARHGEAISTIAPLSLLQMVDEHPGVVTTE